MDYASIRGEITDSNIADWRKEGILPDDISNADVRLISDRFHNEVPLHINRRLNAGSASYDNLLETGVMRNQYELGKDATTSGILGPKKGSKRDMWESAFTDSLFRKIPEYQKLKSGSFLSPSLAKERPFYGYAQELVHDRINGQYGGITFVMKEEVRTRATLTVGDSSYFHGTKQAFKHDISTFQNNKSVIRGFFKACKSHDNFAYAKRVASGEVELIQFTEMGMDYIEAQIYGGVDLVRDVKKIVVGEDYADIRALADKFNIPFEVQSSVDIGRLSTMLGLSGL
ncbi:MAG: DUF3626 domain-containing protein [Candidatus Heimdallarchaeota archaeon]|nr:DUF3626 domain-containing protein [Candidatus Heimdallarchaeota archaeon]